MTLVGVGEHCLGLGTLHWDGGHCLGSKVLLGGRCLEDRNWRTLRGKH